MCRLFGLMARNPVKITFSMLEAPTSLSRQSLDNPHGWGIGYYDGERAIVHKHPERARGSRLFEEVVDQACSSLFVAHVRKRTAGEINLAHTHPFTHAGWILAQNGGIGGAWHKRIKAELGRAPIQGKTSGEHLLYWLYARAGHLAGAARNAALGQALRELIAAPGGITSANFVLATGDCLYAFRYAPAPKIPRSLFYLERHPLEATLDSRQTGLEVWLDPPLAEREQAVIIASDRLTGTEEAWQAVPNGCLLAVSPDLVVQRTLLAVGAVSGRHPVGWCPTRGRPSTC